MLAEIRIKVMVTLDPGVGTLPEDDVALATAEEILGYAEEEFRKAVKPGTSYSIEMPSRRHSWQWS
jgi:hypothetical protein